MNKTPNLRDFLATLTPAQRDKFLQDALQEHQRIANPPADYRTEEGIVRFVRDVLHADPAPYQERILRALVRYKRVAVRAPHGAGKTALAAWVVIWGMYAFNTDVKIPTTASAHRQLTLYLWPEIRRWARRADLNPAPRILEQALKLPDKEAFAIASDDPALLEGSHATCLIAVFDESKAIPSGIFDAIEGAFSNAGKDTDADAYALAISTPGRPEGRFYEIQTRRPGLEDWHVEHITLEEAIAAGRISAEWAEARKRQWGEQSAVYQNRVLGEYADSGESSVIPLAWVEASNDRWHELQGRGKGETVYGVDPARFGTDQTAIARITGRVCEWVQYSAQEDTMQVTGRAAALAGDSPVYVDVIGLGAGVFDRLKETGKDAHPVNASAAATDATGRPLTDKSGELTFVNTRAALWWALREALDPDQDEPLALPPDDALTGDLTAPSYDYDSKGRIRVESKDDIRARIGRSPDGADALALAYWPQFLNLRGRGHTPMTRMVTRGLYPQRPRRSYPPEHSFAKRRIGRG